MPSSFAAKPPPASPYQPTSWVKNGYFRFLTMASVSPLNIRNSFSRFFSACTPELSTPVTAWGLRSAEKSWNTTVDGFGSIPNWAAARTFASRFPLRMPIELVRRKTMNSAPKILLVDDNPADANLTCEVLAASEHPAQVSTVQDGEQALMFLHRQGQFADATRPALIILD